jgi:hypothetical protein
MSSQTSTADHDQARPLRIVTLLARYGTDKYPDALRNIEDLFARQLPGVAHEIVAIDNALGHEHSEIVNSRLTLLGGDNSAWEFSAWDRGIQWLGGRLDSFDFIHLATSAFQQLYVRYLRRFDERMLRVVSGRAVATGHIDYYNEPIMLFGRVMQSWLRSSFVFIPPTELRILGGLASVTDRNIFFSGNPTAPFLPVAPLSEGYRRNILNWLTGGGTGQGVEWHSKITLSNETLPFFENKAMAILNEQMLTCRLQTQGCNIVDSTWLATYVKSRPAEDHAPQVLPHWRSQVTTRDVDAAPPIIR